MSARLERRREACTWAIVAAVAVIGAACGGGGGGGGGTPGKPTGPTATATIPAGGGEVALQNAGTTLTVRFPAGSVPAGSVAEVIAVPRDRLPTPMPLNMLVEAALTNTSNVFVTAFYVDAGASVTRFNVPVALTGAGMTGDLALDAGTVLNVAQLRGNAWVDVATAITNVSGTFSSQSASVALPGVLAPGYYLVYLPAPGSTTVANFGIALIADDGYGSRHGLQVVNLLGADGQPLATPVMTFLEFSGAYDIDGQALTPSGNQGVLVDGGNTVRFFSAVNTGVPIASTKTVNVAAYGGDGDAIAIMPNGDEAIVSADSPNRLVVISGILAADPQLAESIVIPAARDSLVVSSDGSTLLARGYTGLTTFRVQARTPAPGSLGGSIAHSFTETSDFATYGTSVTVAYPVGEDGRCGMAFDPADPTRAVLVGSGAGGQVLQLLTGLDTARPTVTTLALTGVSGARSIAFSPRGGYVVVGTSNGLVLVSVSGTTLTRVNTTPFNPTFTVGASQFTLGTVNTMGFTLDGAYLVATSRGGIQGASDIGSGTLLVFPMLAQPTADAPFGAAVGQLSGVAVPDNDQILMH